MKQLVVAYNNAFRIMHRLPMRCSASLMFANVRVIDSCEARIRKCIYSIMERSSTSTNYVITRVATSGVYLASTLYTAWNRVLYITAL